MLCFTMQTILLKMFKSILKQITVKARQVLLAVEAVIVGLIPVIGIVAVRGVGLLGEVKSVGEQAIVTAGHCASVMYVRCLMTMVMVPIIPIIPIIPPIMATRTQIRVLVKNSHSGISVTEWWTF